MNNPTIFRQGRFGLTLALVAAAAVLPFLAQNYVVFQLTMVMIYAVAVLGLNILTGFNGQISLGHGAFYACGAYCAAILMDRFGLPYWATVPLAGGVCFVFGLLLGFPALRLGGIYLALATFALAAAFPQLLKFSGLEEWTGGSNGILLDKPESPVSFDVFGVQFGQDHWLYFLALAVMLFMFWLAANLMRGRVGRALIAIRDHPTAAAAMGINLPVFKTLTFGISAGFTGIAGAMAGIAVAFVSPDSFTAFLSITLLVGVVFGGLASIRGAVFGALFIMFVPNMAEQISKSAPSVIYGIFLIGFMYLMPTGVAGLIKKMLARVTGKASGLRQ
jgi:branched-chain amino acid transport system permease protein